MAPNVFDLGMGNVVLSRKKGVGALRFLFCRLFRQLSRSSSQIDSHIIVRLLISVYIREYKEEVGRNAVMAVFSGTFLL